MYFVEKSKGTNFIKHFDYQLFIAVLILSVIGIVALKSATLEMPNGNGVFLKQLGCLLAGIIIALIISTMDYKDFKSLGIVLYITSVILLIFVLFKGSGKETWGSNSWLSLPVVGGFQPSELAKISVIVVISMFFERMKEGQQVRNNAIKLMVYTAIPILLILKQPDTGTALVFIFAFFIMLFIYGVPYKYFLISIGMLIASFPVLWLFVLRDHQKERIKTFLFPGSDPLHSSLQVDRSQRTIGSGQIFGKGLYHGIQTQNSSSSIKLRNFAFESVPEKQTDFIFSVIGEELGFIGCIIVLFLVFFILYRCIYIAKNSRDMYGTFIVIGITAVYAFHFIENISMCIGVLPVTGIPLPFMSQGGSALVTNYISLGLLLSVSMRRKRAIFNSSQ